MRKKVTGWLLCWVLAAPTPMFTQQVITARRRAATAGTPSFTVAQDVGQCETSGATSLTFTVGNSYNGVTLNTPTTGNPLVMLTSLYNTINDITSVASVPSGVFTLNGSVVANGGQRLRAASLVSAVGGTTAVVVTELGTDQKCAELIELSVTGGGTFAYDSQDTTGVSQAAATWTSLAFTPTSGKSVIVFGWGMQIGNGTSLFTTAGTGYTALNPGALSSVWSTGGAYKIVTSASGAYTPNGSISSSSNTTSAAVAYKAN